MSEFLRNRFSLETNNYAHFNRGTVTDQRFKDYTRLVDQDNYEPLDNNELNRLNSEQEYGSTISRYQVRKRHSTNRNDETGTNLVKLVRF
ncbi:hypothetical protein AVEN_22219-1 [Araneus ventricosus]|uniref:Uncharacterized protein n=1 Tax=Araneus ventricosus TaxID=182803 RepID=A0A4Y2DQ69_ARAVE|nr:hypothetical protein AVEN_22219-1 [Araneus ventricosus]